LGWALGPWNGNNVGAAIVGETFTLGEVLAVVVKLELAHAAELFRLVADEDGFSESVIVAVVFEDGSVFVGDLGVGEIVVADELGGFMEEVVFEVVACGGNALGDDFAVDDGDFNVLAVGRSLVDGRFGWRRGLGLVFGGGVLGVAKAEGAFGGVELAEVRGVLSI
jgi:hypothetical protein